MKQSDDHDHNDDDTRAGQAITPAPTTAGALTSLAALAKTLSSVDTTAAVGRPVTPLLQFRRDDSGTWTFGQKRTVVEDGSTWAANPRSFRWGFICFSDANKVLGERLVSVSQPKPDLTELPDKGCPWSEQWAVNLKCTSGADAGVEVVYKPTTTGGIQAIAGLIEAIRDRLNGGQHEGKVAPIVRLEKNSYQHSQHGRVWYPVLTIVDWMTLDGPAPAPVPTPAASPAPAEQPRRRRVV